MLGERDEILAELFRNKMVGTVVRWKVQMMRVIALFAILLLSSGTAFAGKTYICDVKSTADFENGFKPIEGEAFWLEHINKIVFDEDSAILKYGSKNAWIQFQMKLWQRGSKDNATVAIYTKEGLASNPVITLRIRPWVKGSPFFWDNAGELYSGTCSVAGN